LLGTQGNCAKRIYEVTGKLVVNYEARQWCRLPYPAHVKGCPNFGRSADCPPKAPLVEKWLDLTRPHWIVVAEFDLEAQAARMLAEHHDWSGKMCRNSRYWQSTVVAELRMAVIHFRMSQNKDLVWSLKPEAMGVDVFETLGKLGIPIQRNPQKLVFKVALVGEPRPQPGPLDAFMPELGGR